ncbi:uncharacterized protein BYT42DRAFT_642244 [Radiomyces spectabilis]|uniref:uncharacterized protein n=1 Tax=Radiomyces spectabilis TaxID=64574 RepID=UPI002220EF56|nr:uncharacterized protein BYT42DRAFT_642244 [Radiomyces spectabilis]KAI8387949.1 hypothetical protein BYT42DRAFT_642244 [Radiomyces spectabilis]
MTTLVMSNVPAILLNWSPAIDILTNTFISFGSAELSCKVPDVIITYENPVSAYMAKQTLSGTKLTWLENEDRADIVRLNGHSFDSDLVTSSEEKEYVIQLSIVEDDEDCNLLRVPRFERNFLISPPGSPPDHWVQTQDPAPKLQADNSSEYIRQQLEQLSDNVTNNSEILNSTEDTVMPSDPETIKNLNRQPFTAQTRNSNVYLQMQDSYSPTD